MEPLGRIHVPRLVHRLVSRRERVSSRPPSALRHGSVVACVQRRADRRRRRSSLSTSTSLEPLEHHLRRASRSFMTRARTSSTRVPRHVRRTRQLIEQLHRHIELAHGAERPRQAGGSSGAPCRPCCPSGPSKAPAPLRAAAARPPAPGERQAHRPAIAAGRWRLRRPGKPLKQHRRYTGGASVHGRMATVRTFPCLPEFASIYPPCNTQDSATG